MRFDIDFHMISDEGEVPASLDRQVGQLRPFLYPKVGQEVEVGDSSGAWMRAVVADTDANRLQLKVVWETYVDVTHGENFPKAYRVRHAVSHSAQGIQNVSQENEPLIDRLAYS